MAEALAILEAMTLVNNRRWRKTAVFSDSLNVISAITKNSSPQEIYGIVNDIREVAALVGEVSFNFIPRKKNSVADELAKEASCTMASNNSVTPGS